MVVRFLSRWYSQQRLKVCWNNVHSAEFGVSNGVRQGGVLSPILFSIYIDELLVDLKRSRIGCSIGSEYYGAFAYADDIVILAPSPSGLRLMLRKCEDFAGCHGLSFNPLKTQLIQFRWHSHHRIHPTINFCGQNLHLQEDVVHLGHILTFNLSDEKDIKFRCQDMVRKANSILCSFPKLSPQVLTYLYSAFCLSLYGCALWNVSSKHIQALEISFNKILRRIWNLPYNSHTRIVQQTAGLSSVFNLILKRCNSLFKMSQKCSSLFVKNIFLKSSTCCFTFLGFNLHCGHLYLKSYSVSDKFRSQAIRDLRLAQSFLSLPRSFIDSVIHSLAT